MTTTIILGISGDSIPHQYDGGAHSFVYQFMNGTPGAGDDGISMPAMDFRILRNGNVICKNLSFPGASRISSGSPSKFNSTYTAQTYLDPVATTRTITNARPSSPTRKYVYFDQIGTNDNALINGSGTVAAFADAMAQKNNDRKTAGWGIGILCTLLPRNDGILTEPNRLAYNAFLTDPAWRAARSIDAVCDFAADATMGNPANCGNLTWFQDGVHPTTAGHARLVPIMAATLAAFGSTL